MSKRKPAAPTPAQALAVYEPQPNRLYDLGAAAQLAGVARRTLLVYCRTGLVQPVLVPPYGMLAFTEEAIRTARQLTQLRVAHGADLALLQTVVGLCAEVARLRAELRFWRHQ